MLILFFLLLLLFFSEDTEVEFSAAVAGHAGLPNWLSVLQVNRISPAYIFGTPAANNIGNITLEVSDDCHCEHSVSIISFSSQSYVGVLYLSW